MVWTARAEICESCEEIKSPAGSLDSGMDGGHEESMKKVMRLMREMMKTTKNLKKLTMMSCAVLTLCLAVSGCGGKDGDGEKKDPVAGLEAVPLDGESEAGTGTAQGDAASGEEQDSASAVDSSQEPSTEAGNPESDAAPTEAGTPGGEGGGESAAAAPQINAEILREARTDDGGEEIAFAEYPMFTLAGGGSEGLSAALDTINAQCRSQSETLLDELQEDVKEYRGSVDPASVFGQGTQAHIYRCDTDVVSIMVMRTVNMGGPHPNNYWDYYNLNAKTGENLQLSRFLTMDEAMVENVIGRLHENYPEVEFDDAVSRAEIPEIVAGDGIGWYFYEGQINLAFPEGSFGLGHAVGSLEVTVPLE